MSVQITHQGLAALVKALGITMREETADKLNSQSIMRQINEMMDTDDNGKCKNCGKEHDKERPDVRGAYDHSDDTIIMPAGQSVATTTDASVLLHEIIHWSGHTTRLNRTGVMGRDSKHRLTMRDSTLEELVAEMGAERLARWLGLETYAETTYYLFGYLDLFVAAGEGKNLEQVVREADAEAQRAVEYITKTATANGFSQKIDRQAA